MGLHGPFDDRSGGIVSDLRGNPLENASVEIFLNGETVPFASLRTDANGGYKFHAPSSAAPDQPPPPIRIAVSREGFESSVTLKNPSKIGRLQHQLVPLSWQARRK